MIYSICRIRIRTNDKHITTAPELTCEQSEQVIPFRHDFNFDFSDFPTESEAMDRKFD